MKKRIKIAFFAEILIEEFDGASRTMFQILKRIPKDRFEFLFFCGVGPDRIYDFDCMRIPAITIPFNPTYKMAVPLLAKTQMKRKLEEFKPDLVHIATPSSLGSFALAYAVSQHLPVITIYHTHFISYVDYYLKRLPALINPVKSYISGFQTRFYNKCNLIYIPSESIAVELIEAGLNRQLIRIWKRGMDTRLFDPIKRNASFVHNLTGNNRPIILFASRLVWEKNLQILLDLYALVKIKSLPYHFLIVGDGVAMEACKKQMPDATFLGTVDHETLAQIYASSDVFFFPSVSESYGNVVLEAMASGLPVVIADGGGSRDFIEQGVNGFKCSPYDAEAYLEKIELVLKEPDIRKALSVAGRAYSLLFDWETLVAQYFNDAEKLVALTHQTPRK